MSLPPATLQEPSLRRSAVVTGGAGGIGTALLARLAQDGFAPVSWDIATHAAPETLALAVDVTDETAIQRAAADTVQRAGPIGALVVNAGILGPVARAWEIPAADIRRVIDTNLVSAFLTIRAAVPLMLQNPGPDRGRIVLMASVQGKEGTALAGPYAAAKAGLIALTKVLGKELATEGILVNAVAPTVVRTAMLTEITAERRADLLARIPMSRFLDTSEVAAMVSWLCSPACSFSTGAVFDLSGGRATY
jgi:3-oxoacyl-[acyl-carrier protein] reductase